MALLLALALAATSLTTACGGEIAEPHPIERSVFIQTYVELRTSALSTDEGEISDSARDAILESNAVSADDLLYFVEVWSENLEFMRGVWDEIEVRMDAVSAQSEES